MKSYGEKIKQLRKSKGYSLKELGKILGLSDTGLMKIENGVTQNVSIEVGKKLSEVFNIPFYELFDLKDRIDEIEKLKNKIDSLERENRLLRMDLELYREKLMFYKENNMLTAPSKDESIDYEDADSVEAMIESISKTDKEHEDLYKRISKNPRLQAEIDKDLEGRDNWYTQKRKSDNQ